jgi:RND family efflux transporter MFP subunit
MANKSGLGLKLLGVVLVLAVAAWAGRLFLRPVAKVATVVSGPAINAVPGSVVIEAEKVMELKSEAGGRILTSALDPGKVVKEGDLLVQIDSGDLDLEISRLQSEYDAKQRQLAVGSAIALELETAKASLEFDERQAARGQLARIDLEKRQRAVKEIDQRLQLEGIANRLSLSSYENSLAKNKRQKEKMSIVAPFDGQVTAVFAYKGALIGNNERIGTLITTTRTVTAKISEENFSGIKIGQKADVTFLGGAGGREPNWDYPAKVSKILPTADPETQRYIVYLDVDIPVEDLIPGKTGEVTITINQRQAKAIVPRRALIGDYVYVVKDGRVEIRKVAVGYTWLDGAEIKEGLQPGETVIVENQDTFHDGDRVSVDVVIDPKSTASEAKPAANDAKSAKKDAKSAEKKAN